MIISAMSQMTRRSRAVNLMAFSINDQTLGAVIGIGTRNKLVETPPDFTIRGSVSQFDENVVRKQGDAGIGIGAFSAGYAKQGTASVLALDLSVINTNTLNLVPGRDVEEFGAGPEERHRRRRRSQHAASSASTSASS